ncbi:hypothetical protein ACX1NX_11490 [Acinetobacter sp. ANC 5383]
MYATLITEYDLNSYFPHNHNQLNEIIQSDGIEKSLKNSYLFYLPKSSQQLADLQHILNKDEANFQIIYSEKKPESFIHCRKD